jgi:hypothetical protein
LTTRSWKSSWRIVPGDGEFGTIDLTESGYNRDHSERDASLLSPVDEGASERAIPAIVPGDFEPESPDEMPDSGLIDFTCAVTEPVQFVGAPTESTKNAADFANDPESDPAIVEEITVDSFCGRARAFELAVAADGGYLTDEYKLSVNHGTPMQATVERPPSTRANSVTGSDASFGEMTSASSAARDMIFAEMSEDIDQGGLTAAGWHRSLPTALLPLIAAGLVGREFVRRRRDAKSAQRHA